MKNINDIVDMAWKHIDGRGNLKGLPKDYYGQDVVDYLVLLKSDVSMGRGSDDKAGILYCMRYVLDDDYSGDIFEKDYLAKKGEFSVSVEEHPQFTDRHTLRVRGTIQYGFSTHEVEAVYKVVRCVPELTAFFAVDRNHSKTKYSWHKDEGGEAVAHDLAQDLADRVFYSIDSVVNVRKTERPYADLLKEMLR